MRSPLVSSLVSNEFIRILIFKAFKYIGLEKYGEYNDFIPFSNNLILPNHFLFLLELKIVQASTLNYV